METEAQISQEQKLAQTTRIPPLDIKLQMAEFNKKVTEEIKRSQIRLNSLVNSQASQVFQTQESLKDEVEQDGE